jgi:hypothetical protein
VTEIKLSNNAVTLAKVKDGSPLAGDFNDGQLRLAREGPRDRRV